MATGSTTDDETPVLERLPPASTVPRRVLSGLVHAPGRSAALAMVVVLYLWLFAYMAMTALGLRGDPIVASDWLTLVFTSYALLSSLALAQRILTVGIEGLTREYLVDALALTWLTAFYFVWMLARESVATTTTFSDLYGPVLAGQPDAIASALVVGVTALVTAGLVYRADEESELFRTRFRTALVTLPGAVTATVLVFQPGPGSVLWLLVGGVFVGTLVAGLLYLQRVAGWVAKGAFAVCSLAAWTVGAVGWLVAYRERPPNEHIVLEHVTFDQTARSESSADTSSRGGAAADDE